MEHYLTANIDGGSRPNPGPAGYGVVIRHGEKVVARLAEFIGSATNNVAEYRALIAALKYAVNAGAYGLFVYSDSEVIVRQVRGEYKVNSAELMNLWAEAKALEDEIKVFFAIEHVYRENNTEADALYNECLDRAKLEGKF
jgi:ribonuclease HI